MLNQIMNRLANQQKPNVGDGATVLAFTDRYAGTIINWWTVGKSTYVKVQRDYAKRVDSNGMSEMQDYEYQFDPFERIFIFKSVDGKPYYEVKLNPETQKYNRYDGGLGLLIGTRREYYDFSF